MLEETNPVPHVELLDISHRKCTSLSNTVMWYLNLLIIDISPMEFDRISFKFPCRLTCVHVTFFFLTHQFIGAKALEQEFWPSDILIRPWQSQAAIIILTLAKLLSDIFFHVFPYSNHVANKVKECQRNYVWNTSFSRKK